MSDASRLRPSRRQVLQGLGAAVGTGALACGSGGDKSGGPDGGGRAAPDAGPGSDGAPRTDAGRWDAAVPTGADAGRGPSCQGDSGMSAAELLAEIETIVVLCMENRSFDHYFGSLSLREGRDDVDGLRGGESNPDSRGEPVEVFRLDDFTPADPPHEWGSCHDQWNEGANDGFVRAHAGANERQVMGYYERDQLPQLYALADQSALCDRWFCSLLGPTWPNRYYLHGGSSNGQIVNFPAFGFQHIFTQLEAASVSSLNYFHDIAWATGAYTRLTGLGTIESFFEAAREGSLPQFALIDPHFFGAGANDDHPSHDVRLGQALIGSVVAALAQSPQWNRCLFVLTYDEHGGFYDHVAPPQTVDEREAFRQLGFRVPSLVASPFARRGCVVSNVLEHTSVPSTLTTRFGLQPLNQRVAATADLSCCIDPAYFGNPQPAPELPPVEVSLSALRSRPDDPIRHAELRRQADAMHLSRALDRRAESLEIAERVLRYGERLGAVRVRR